MTGAGAPGAAGIIKCLLQEPKLDLVVADADKNAIGKHLHPAFFTIPKATDAHFADTLLALCKAEGVNMIMPLVTKELFPLSQNKLCFQEAGITVLTSTSEAIAVANNKAACYQFLQTQNIPVPAFFVADTAEAFIHGAFELGHPHEPFCFKPCVANGSRGFVSFRTVSTKPNSFSAKAL
jgi:carbamoyl-phosphate synthase large subunit